MGAVCTGGGVAFKHLGVTIVGSPEVGKSALIIKFKSNSTTDVDNTVTEATVRDNAKEDGKLDPFCAVLRLLDRSDYSVSVVDTHSSVSGNDMRSISYGSTNVVVICFAINDRRSFTDVKTIWCPEIKKYLTKAYPVILCGTKKDTRSEISAGDPSIISREEGVALSKEISAYGYVECSIETNEGVDAVVKLAADEARKYMYPKQLLESYSSRLL
jgi:small GTP-binding protein